MNTFQKEIDASAKPDGSVASSFLHYISSPESREAHRRDYSDLEWAGVQPTGEPKYKIGDVVEFHVGGFGVIDSVSAPKDGWPASYSVEEIEGLPFREDGIGAWHYEGDFKAWVAKSPLRSPPYETLKAATS